ISDGSVLLGAVANSWYPPPSLAAVFCTIVQQMILAVPPQFRTPPPFQQWLLPLFRTRQLVILTTESLYFSETPAPADSAVYELVTMSFPAMRQLTSSTVPSVQLTPPPQRW